MNKSLQQHKIITSPDGIIRAQVNLAGGIVSSLYYDSLPESLLYQAPWLNEQQVLCNTDIPILLKRLSGEWVGIPFGAIQKDSDVFYVDAPHGLPVNQMWQWQESDEHHVILTFDYPDDYPLQKLTRKIIMQDNGKIVFSLMILPRQDCHLPIGLHPIFPFDGELGPLEISISQFTHGVTYPKQTEPNVSQLQTGATFYSLSQLPTIDAKSLDLSKLPLTYNTEEIIQIIQPQNGVQLRYPKHQLEISLEWDTQILPDCLLWISHRGRTSTPWLGRNCCLGVEPICSAWDLGPDSLANNAINAWSPTFISFNKGKVITLNYQIQCKNY